MDAPQIAVIVLLAISLVLGLVDHGKPRPPTNFWITLISDSIVIALLIWGGYFK